jgi:hypothetical protein
MCIRLFLIAGRANGSLTQYKPDLKEAKTIPGPQGKNLTAISILWISTYQFIVGYKDNADPNSRPGKSVFLFVDVTCKITFLLCDRYCNNFYYFEQTDFKYETN